MAAENGSQNSGERKFVQPQPLLLSFQVEAGVDGGSAAGAVDFEGAKEGVGFATGGLEPGEVVRDEDPGRVGEVRDPVGISEKETGGPGHV